MTETRHSWCWRFFCEVDVSRRTTASDLNQVVRWFIDIIIGSREIFGYRRGLGVVDPRKPFHAWGNGFQEACRAAGVQEEVHDAITGHLGGGVGRGYGGVPLASKAKAVAKVRYDVDLSDLHVPCEWDSC